MNQERVPGKPNFAHEVERSGDISRNRCSARDLAEHLFRCAQVHSVELACPARVESQGGSGNALLQSFDATAVDAFSKITRWYMAESWSSSRTLRVRTA